MTEQTRSDQQWNIFARELTDILASHHIPVAQLYLHITILPDKVRRLHQSLFIPDSFPLLSQDEIQQLIQVCNLTETEQIRLRAALLTTAIEKLLIERLQPDAALLAASTLFPLIASALQQRFESLSPFDTMHRGDLVLSEDDESDRVLLSAWQAIDQGSLALHLSYHVASHEERLDQARYARQKFGQSLAELDEVANESENMQSWNNWHMEAQRGLQDAKARLEELGDL
ncbi:MAG TPA: hypothetical protein VNG51_20785 [Ktedonobacteraceae bacterium]|nr:hypothetical protein [Ktedonobacteraceae bacterium]